MWGLTILPSALLALYSTLGFPELAPNSRRLYLATHAATANDEAPLSDMDAQLATDLASSLSHIPLDVIASSHWEASEETARRIREHHKDSTLVMSHKLATESIETGLRQAFFNQNAKHVCLIANNSFQDSLFKSLNQDVQEALFHVIDWCEQKNQWKLQTVQENQWA